MSHFNVHEPKGIKGKLLKNMDIGTFQQTPPSYKPPKKMPNLTEEQPEFILKQICVKGLYRIHCMALKNGEQLWFCPTFVKGQTLYGWRFYHNRWIFLVIHLSKVQSIQCI
ncbi:hypothetical protein [Cytobacillus sp. FSL R7-0680]|uniref:hypothetical protein n=1 Tax=Cytobacillus sp. FSL R7-0680 TaxID=2921689 RepID=UPI0030FBDCF0